MTAVVASDHPWGKRPVGDSGGSLCALASEAETRLPSPSSTKYVAGEPIQLFVSLSIPLQPGCTNASGKQSPSENDRNPWKLQDPHSMHRPGSVRCSNRKIQFLMDWVREATRVSSVSENIAACSRSASVKLPRLYRSSSVRRKSISGRASARVIVRHWLHHTGLVKTN